MKLPIRILGATLSLAGLAGAWLAQGIEFPRVPAVVEDAISVSTDAKPLQLYCPGPLTELGGKDGTDPEKNLLELTQMVALMSMLEGRDEDPDAVRMSTLHAAKGLEWDVVFIMGLTEGYLPITYALTDSAIREEQRLLYVGLTRARRELNLSWARQELTSSREREQSRFLVKLQARG